MARFDRTIPPGGEGNITLEIKTKGFQGQVHKSARVRSNDPKKPQVTIGLKGKVWAPIIVKPRYVRLRGAEDDETRGVVRIQGDKKEPLVAKLVSVSPPDKIDASLREVEKGRTYELDVINKVKGAARYTGNLKLTTNYPEKPEIVIRVTGDIRGRLEVRPNVVNFGRMPLARLEELKNHPRGMSRTVAVILNKGNNLKVEKVELEKSLFKVSTDPVRPGLMTKIVVKPVLEKLKKGPNEDRLKIFTNQKGREVLEVPIRFDLL